MILFETVVVAVHGVVRSFSGASWGFLYCGGFVCLLHCVLLFILAGGWCGLSWYFQKVYYVFSKRYLQEAGISAVIDFCCLGGKTVFVVHVGWARDRRMTDYGRVSL